MDGENWLYLLLTALAGWLARVQYVVSQHPEKYVPRPQIDSRFAAVERRWERELHTMEKHSEKQFEQVNAKLDRIIDQLQMKADK